MEWMDYILQALGNIAAVSFLAMLLAKYLVDRRLQQDRVRFETQMQTLLQDLRARGEKENFVH